MAGGCPTVPAAQCQRARPPGHSLTDPGRLSHPPPSPPFPFLSQMPFRSSLLHSAILASLPRPIIDLFLAHRRPTAASRLPPPSRRRLLRARRHPAHRATSSELPAAPRRLSSFSSPTQPPSLHAGVALILPPATTATQRLSSTAATVSPRAAHAADTTASINVDGFLP